MGVDGLSQFQNSEGLSFDASKTVDPFNPEQLRLSQDFATNLGIKKAILTIPIRKPSKEDWIRVHSSQEYQLQTGVLELKETREVYLVTRELWPALSNEATFGPRLLLTCVNRQSVLFLWPIRLPGSDGKLDSWNRTALEAVDLATKRWVRLVSNMSLGGYDVYEATADLPEPQWPELPFREILHIAFKNYLIESLDHPVLRRLRGEC